MFKSDRFSLRTRIFLTVLFLIGLTSVLIVWVTVSQFKTQAQRDFHARFETKEVAARKNVNYELERTIFPVSSQFLSFIFRDRIYEIATVHDMKMSIYNLAGVQQINSVSPWYEVEKESISKKILKEIRRTNQYQFSKNIGGDVSNQTSFSFIEDPFNTKIGILKIEYKQDNTLYETALEQFLNKLYLVYIVMFVIAVILAYFLTRYITQSLLEISENIQEIKLNSKNKKIAMIHIIAELEPLVGAYNQMIDELEISANKLAKGEREHAWREMAKQVAHEIKNPLTPMRLTVQSFQRNFDPNALDVYERVNDYSEMLIQQIDVMSDIATAFSDFAQMPAKQLGMVDLIVVIKSSLDIFNDVPIKFTAPTDKIFLLIDKNQLTRVVNNLVKNAIQACEEQENPYIEVVVFEEEKQVVMKVVDNGKGIDEQLKSLIFEPKFTTKSSGMGLGLPMVKNIIESFGGSISFVSEISKGTVFTVILPKNTL